jgi:hypothetical protein
MRIRAWYFDYDEYEECVNLNCKRHGFSKQELSQAVRLDNVDNKFKFCLYLAEDKGISLYEYLFLCDGQYVIGLCISSQCCN